jgi:threonine/homoserine/homoserine lactone efflux protein
MTFESAVAFSLALFIWVLIPGPAILAIVGRSLTTNLKSALKLIVGILLGDLF